MKMVFYHPVPGYNYDRLHKFQSWFMITMVVDCSGDFGVSAL